ncbi:AbrB/MazE/SpoVT family DNA-binding domain-containing protein [Candidatus Methylocalor cossyra]|uniref:Transcriptional regulator, AbrB family n=1 Tax=Candidatus Methylocalor cossyra TaxID=3108543 RepID=A0ABM9NML4_9GAMM
MRITRKGQVTIPSEIRKLAGLEPQMEVEFRYQNGMVILVKLPERPDAVEQARGMFKGRGMSTDEVMRLTRGED